MARQRSRTPTVTPIPSSLAASRAVAPPRSPCVGTSTSTRTTPTAADVSAVTAHISNRSRPLTVPARALAPRPKAASTTARTMTAVAVEASVPLRPSTASWDPRESDPQPADDDPDCNRDRVRRTYFCPTGRLISGQCRVPGGREHQTAFEQHREGLDRRHHGPDTEEVRTDDTVDDGGAHQAECRQGAPGEGVPQGVGRSRSQLAQPAWSGGDCASAETSHRDAKVLLTHASARDVGMPSLCSGDLHSAGVSPRPSLDNVARAGR